MFAAPIAAMTILAQAAAGPAPSATTTPAASAPPGSASNKTVSEVTVEGQKQISKRREVDPDQVTCHNELPPGTRFAIKVCATNRQFAQRTREQQEMFREWLDTPKSSKAQ